MAASNQKRLTLAPDDTIEELWNDAKNINTCMSLRLSVWKTWCEEKSIALEINEHKLAEVNRLLKKFYPQVKKKYDLPALSPRRFFFPFRTLISNHVVFSFNLELICTGEFFKKLKLHWPKVAHAISPFWKAHKCKLIPNWTWDRKSVV